MNTIHALVAICLFTSFCLRQASAASFPCENASKPIEKAICNTPDLDELDTALGVAYRNALHRAPDGDSKKKLIQDETEWIRSYDGACSALAAGPSIPFLACIRRSLTERTQQLTSIGVDKAPDSYSAGPGSSTSTESNASNSVAQYGADQTPPTSSSSVPTYPAEEGPSVIDGWHIYRKESNMGVDNLLTLEATYRRQNGQEVNFQFQCTRSSDGLVNIPEASLKILVDNGTFVGRYQEGFRWIDFRIRFGSDPIIDRSEKADTYENVLITRFFFDSDITSRNLENITFSDRVKAVSPFQLKDENYRLLSYFYLKENGVIGDFINSTRLLLELKFVDGPDIFSIDLTSQAVTNFFGNCAGKSRSPH